MVGTLHDVTLDVEKLWVEPNGLLGLFFDGDTGMIEEGTEPGNGARGILNL
ncbi:hypothetical protein LTR56_025919 [Elasticomyces elasticus]|nr:hypothetical protein LTR56_025919 [Elasticomyces elasticus]KAK3618310.1 hypothetical protein LTR22_026420 [Elasticomyces elasticus]KAK4902989.1 hypothetical protein LTR49_026942 [Elasticomyces elasticus]KAK5689384.1 hypothetical protein LTR17_026288 [Elasticomyces elasticus]KAK5737081.1 hypothetical protein LTS12_025999 [Elasticomyces elasticus]